MARRTSEDALRGWALDRLAALLPDPASKATKAKARRPAFPEGAGRAVALGERFSLTAAAWQVLELVGAAEAWLDVAQVARALSGRRGLTVELLRAALGLDEGELRELLDAAAPLRAHGLVMLSGLPGGLPVATALVELAPGMAEHLAGRKPLPTALGPGITRVEAEAERAPLPPLLSTVVREELAGGAARWVSLGGVGAGEARALAAAVARRLTRPALLVDARTLALLAAGEAWSLLAAARREADLGATVVVVDGAATLGGLLRALGGEPAPAPGTRVVLCDAGATVEQRPHPGFVVSLLALAPRVSTVEESAPATISSQPSAIDAARRQAALDAAKAMGRPLNLPPPAPPPPSPSPPSPPAPPPVAAAPPAPSPSAPPPAAPVDREAAHQIVGSSVPASRRRAAARAAAPAPVVPTPAAPEVAAPAPATESPAVAPAPSPGTAAVEKPAAADPAEQLPYLPVPDDATLADLLRILYETQNPLQRAQLLRRIAGEHKDVRVAVAVRDHLRAEHPAVRAAAEFGMVTLFGPQWNRSRPIPKPVQPPRSDD